MDSLTGRRRRKDPQDDNCRSDVKRCLSSTSSTSSVVLPGPIQPTEFIPQLYKSQSGKKVFVEQPGSVEERDLIRDLPCDTEVAILHLRNTFPVQYFHGRLPPIILHSQLTSILSNRVLLEVQLTKLAKTNRILTFSTFSSSNYLITLLEDFVQLEREPLFERFVNQVIKSPSKMSGNEGVNGSNSKGGGMDERSEVRVSGTLDNAKYFSRECLRKLFEEDEVRLLVNGGYLGVQEGGFYCISLPGAGDFTKCYEKGKKAVINAIKRAKFGEILQSELEQRSMKKTAPLGVIYHIHDLVGSGLVHKVETTSGPLLRLRRTS